MRGDHLPDIARARQQLERFGRDARLVAKLDREGSEQRGLLGRLGNHGVAGCKRG